MSDHQPSTTEIRRVRRWECETRGHTFTEILTVGRLAPQKILCTHCGASWALQHPDRNWGDDGERG